MNRLDLINAINDFDGFSDQSYLRLRDLVCEMSESKAFAKDESIKELLYIASQKMRNFGYNAMNDFTPDVITNGSRKNINAIVDQYYTSDSGYKLDYEQKKALDIYESLDNKRLFLSAPTAFGKTFILQEILLKNNYDTILLIFPTVSLLNENTKTINRFIERRGLNYKVLSSTRELADDNDKKIYILTPERVLKLLSSQPNISIDFFFMDEIYKVDNFFDSSDSEEEPTSERDQVFRIVLYILSKRVKDFYLAGPYINTDALGLGFSKYLATFNVAVHRVDKEMISKQHLMAWTTKLTLDGKVYTLPSASYEKLLAIIGLIGNLDYGRSLIYMANKSQIDQVSKRVIATNRLLPVTKSDRLKRFLTHLKTRYSVDDYGVDTVRFWSLPKMLQAGFGIHHGSLPKYVQVEILELFNAKQLDVMISTTSITEGVNIDAKNVVFYGATKGGKELKVFDIKNINGRAGRYYHNFIGRIFYLNKNVKKTLDERMDEALDFSIFGNKDIDKVDLDNAEVEDLNEKNARLKQEREHEISQSGIPQEILGKNRLVDKLKQVHMIQSLEKHERTYFEKKARSYSSVQGFLENKELPQLMNFLFDCGLIDEYKRKAYPAIATNYSISGFPGLLQYEISKARERAEGSELSDQVYDACYRRAFDKIRTVIEFQIPRLLTIYSHVFEYVCQKQGVKFNAETFDSIVMFFELGVFTNVGVILAEKGFPINAVKLLEERYEDFMADVQTFTGMTANSDQLAESGLDEYEIDLLLRLMS
jgi:superfamily II DNA/RNA helicase